MLGFFFFFIYCEVHKDMNVNSNRIYIYSIHEIIIIRTNNCQVFKIQLPRLKTLIYLGEINLYTDG